MLAKKILTTTTCSVALILSVVFGIDNQLKTSEPGLAHVANLEGCRSQAYQCSANTWTTGIGHTSGVKEGETVTNQEIANNFVSDIAHAERVVNASLTKPVTQSQYDVMVSFVFNLGEGNFKQSTMLKLFNQGKPAQACEQLMRWVYVSGKNCNDPKSNCKGIVTRRQIERDACLNGWTQ
ncbi:lysozyme [Enterovibrio nigricans]|uniref:Lysozyme n=1 Tax=Enterovibrio nigricans DSM 22720 TaxID=1121868 RepID=A0A1T4UV36_9GAMM|nr:lysozyme [Enterovibrio nigricans]PKF50912.1 lysozyme [Enterovibrio nigricans]SKA56589.1 lysozyme [Enterovibrio nigricans DSM 22720]